MRIYNFETPLETRRRRKNSTSGHGFLRMHTHFEDEFLSRPKRVRRGLLAHPSGPNPIPDGGQGPPPDPDPDPDPQSPPVVNNAVITLEQGGLGTNWSYTIDASDPDDDVVNLIIDMTSSPDGAIWPIPQTDIPSSSASVGFDNLPYGNYTFEVTAVDSGGRTSAPFPVTVTYLPPSGNLPPIGNIDVTMRIDSNLTATGLVQTFVIIDISSDITDNDGITETETTGIITLIDGPVGYNQNLTQPINRTYLPGPPDPTINYVTPDFSLESSYSPTGTPFGQYVWQLQPNDGTTDGPLALSNPVLEPPVIAKGVSTLGRQPDGANWRVLVIPNTNKDTPEEVQGAWYEIEWGDRPGESGPPVGTMANSLPTGQINFVPTLPNTDPASDPNGFILEGTVQDPTLVYTVRMRVFNPDLGLFSTNTATSFFVDPSLGVPP